MPVPAAVVVPAECGPVWVVGSSRPLSLSRSWACRRARRRAFRTARARATVAITKTVRTTRTISWLMKMPQKSP
ncbi:hypothetical protein STAL104432_12860 [Streptomyces albus]